MPEFNQSLNKGLIVTELLIKHKQLTLKEIHIYSHFSKQAILRCLDTLITRDWIRKRENDKRYVWIGIANSMHIDDSEMMAKICMPILQNLTVKTGLAADLALLNDQGVLTLIDSTSRKGVDGINTHVVGHQPSIVMSALGRAFLYACDEQVFEKFYAKVLKSGSLAELNHLNTQRFKDEKNRCLSQGCSVREESDYIPQAAYENSSSMAVAVPLMQSHKSKLGCSIGAINLVWGDQSITTSMVLSTHLSLLKSTSDQLSNLLSAI